MLGTRLPEARSFRHPFRRRRVAEPSSLVEGGRTKAPVVVVLALALAMLAGCTNPSTTPETTPPPVDPHRATLVIPVGAFNPDGGGPWYVPETLNLAPPARILVRNNDTVWHRIMAIAGETGTPDWVQKASSGAHSHAASATVFDVSLDPGQEEEVEVTQQGPIHIHCHPHPWMTGTLIVDEPGAHEYPVVLNELSLTAALNGIQVTGSEEARTFTLDAGAPNLEEIRLFLAWDDGKDDGAAGPTANQPDTMQLTLIDPTGKVRAASNGTARDGAITVSLRPGPGWPATVTAGNWMDAQRRVDEAHPPTTRESGKWRVEVRLVAAPGPLSQTPGAPQAAGQADGQQAWTLQVDVIHAWGVAAGLPAVIHGTLQVTE